MKKAFIGVMSVLLGVMIQAPSVTAGTLVEFEGGIGVIPVSRVDGTGATGSAVRNVVRGVSPGGQPWVIRQFKAKVKTNSSITAEGKGLVLAGSDAIGTAGAVTAVAVTLFCAAETAPDGHSSGPHPLAANGDFKFTDTLSLPVPPACPTPTLLIRARTSAGAWIAAGILEVGEEED